MSALRRVRFAEGQLVRLCDLQAALGAESRRRVLHVRAVHATGGVALGFAVGVGRSRRGAVVGPGFGYDRRGREVVCARTVFVPAPTADGSYDLAVSGERPEWTWLEPGHAREELVLARFDLADGELERPDVDERRCARGPGGRLAAGTAYAQPEPVIAVDTSAAGFERTPYYFATLAEVALSPWPAGPFVELASPSPTGFELTLRAGRGWRDTVQQEAHVHWVGVELPASCGGFEPDTDAVADPLDLPDEYATFEAVPPTTETSSD